MHIEYNSNIIRRRNIMNWETVKIKNDQRGRTMPYASVGFGRLSLSTAACELIENFESYTLVELLKANDGNKLFIGVRFLKSEDRTENALPIKRRMVNGKIVGGIDIMNKGMMQDLFGDTGTQNRVTRFCVKKDPDDSNILIIY